MIDINFAQKDYRLFVRVYSGLIAAIAALVIAGVVMLWSLFSYRANISSMDGKVKDLSVRHGQVSQVLLERERLVRDFSTMSALMDARRFSWTQLFTSIEAAFPTGVALDKVEFNPKDRSLALEGKAQSPESLRNLMVGLERSSSFKDPYLKHQSVEKGRISFSVVAAYQNNKGAGVAQGK